MPWPVSIHPPVQAAYASRGISTPWEHQVRALESIASGHDTVITTGTGSGKSLVAWAPVLSTISSHSKSSSLADVKKKPTALYLAPTKALAADQYASLADLAQDAAPDAGIAVVDGDAPTEMRSWARSFAHIVLSNPDFVHAALLAGHERWSRFFAGLRYVIIDEFHTYRGNTGANVALVMRRLLRIARHYGAHPTVIFLSATTSNPQIAASRFLGPDREYPTIIDVDTSSHAAFDLLVVRPKVAPGINEDVFVEKPEERARRSVTTEAAHLASVAVNQDARTLVFARSRAGTEALAEAINDELGKNYSPYTGQVLAYRGGYLPEERRDLEDGLRSGRIRGLATTNALELGIDISGLDVVIVAGWPGTHSSFRQQLGRAGRRGHAGIGVFITRDDPLDEYFASHVDMLTAAPVEEVVFDPTNPYVLHNHIIAAAAEIPLTADDTLIFDCETSLFDEFVDAGLLVRRAETWRWNVALGTNAHSLVDIRGAGSEVSIIDQTTGSLLGTVPGERADATVYPNAIYIHQGEPFIVNHLEEERALVEPYRDEEIRTFAVSESNVEITDTHRVRHLDHGSLSLGSVIVSSQITGYDIRRATDGMYLGRVGLDLPVRSLATTACWWTLSATHATEIGLTPDILPGALHGFEHTAIGLLPLFATCDRWDIGGLSTAFHHDTEMPTVFIHDAVLGGSGCSERGHSRALEWVEATVQRLEDCPCREGCPSCVQSPKCGNGNNPLSKSGALLLGQTLLAQMRRASAS